jgi:hypothetical protein
MSDPNEAKRALAEKQTIAILRRELKWWAFGFGILIAVGNVVAGIIGYNDILAKAKTAAEEHMQGRVIKAVDEALAKRFPSEEVKTTIVNNAAGTLAGRVNSQVDELTKGRYVLADQPYAIKPYNRDNRSQADLDIDLILTLDSDTHVPNNHNNHAKLDGPGDQQRWAFVSNAEMIERQKQPH